MKNKPYVYFKSLSYYDETWSKKEMFLILRAILKTNHWRVDLFTNNESIRIESELADEYSSYPDKIPFCG